MASFFIANMDQNKSKTEADYEVSGYFLKCDIPIIWHQDLDTITLK